MRFNFLAVFFEDYIQNGLNAKACKFTGLETYNRTSNRYSQEQALDSSTAYPHWKTGSLPERGYANKGIA